MSAVDQHAEAHRLKNELGYGARRIAGSLGISRYAAEQLLDRPLPAPVAEAAGVAAAVADEVAGPVGRERPVADEERPVAVPVGQAAEAVQPPVLPDSRPPLPVRPVAGMAGPVADGLADTRPRQPGPWLRMSLAHRPSLASALWRMARMGLRIPEIVDLAVRSFAAAYHVALVQGDVQPGQPYEVQTLIRPCRHWAA